VTEAPPGGPKKGPTEGSGSKAPLVVFGGMIFIGVVALLIVFVNHCRRDEPYLDPQEIERGTPDRVPPPPPQPATP
jgi:hypothetical protein